MTAQHILDTDEGLERLMGDHGLYGQVLLRFRKDYGQAVAQMRQLLADGAQEAAQRKVHSMKGAAGMIGAQELHRLAGVAEAELAAPGAATGAAAGAASSSAAHAALDVLQTALDSLLRAIAAHVDGNDAGAGGAAAPASPLAQPARPVDAQALIARLTRLLDEGDGEAIDVLEQSATMLAASLGVAVFQEVAAAAHEFDYQAALAALTRARPTLSA